ncbi:MAG: preprotein translocase subunit SecG [Anaerolineales bacterium]|nr:preprotein translocase subunit SecG [Anaerolineales bacterium]
METIINIALIIISVALIASVVLQSKGAGLGGLSGQESGGFFSARRGIEKTLFYATIAFSVIFFSLALIAVLLVG